MAGIVPEIIMWLETLNKDGLATLLVDLLTSEEEQTDISTERLRDKIPGVVLNKFNIALLTDRLISMTDWILQNPDTKRLPLGYFGASTGTGVGHCWQRQRFLLRLSVQLFPVLEDQILPEPAI